MADKVKNIPGAIGYVEYQYAVKNKIAQAAVLNLAGRFVKASPESMSAACEAAETPRWNNFSASLTNATGPDSFPITSFTWIYLRNASPDAARAAALGDLLNWIYGDGQRYAIQEGYAELPQPLLAAVRKKLNTPQ
jgi:phosphate transport system substrate-binding protein